MVLVVDEEEGEEDEREEREEKREVYYERCEVKVKAE